MNLVSSFLFIIAAINATPVDLAESNQVIDTSVYDQHYNTIKFKHVDSTNDELIAGIQKFAVSINRKDDFKKAGTDEQVMTREVEYDLEFIFKDPALPGQDPSIMCNDVDVSETKLISLTTGSRVTYTYPKDGEIQNESQAKQFADAKHRGIVQLVIGVNVEEIQMTEFPAFINESDPDFWQDITKTRRYTFSETIIEVDGSVTTTAKLTQHVVDVYQHEHQQKGLHLLLRNHQPQITEVGAEIKKAINEKLDGQPTLQLPCGGQSSKGNSQLKEKVKQFKGWWKNQSNIVKSSVIAGYLVFLCVISFALAHLIVSFYQRFEGNAKWFIKYQPLEGKTQQDSKQQMK